MHFSYSSAQRSLGSLESSSFRLSAASGGATGPGLGFVGGVGLGGLKTAPICSQAAAEPFLHAQSSVVEHPGPGPGPAD
jgi:hypothetical protein